MHTSSRFTLLLACILVTGLLSALLDAVIGWENLATQFISRLAA